MAPYLLYGLVAWGQASNYQQTSRSPKASPKVHILTFEVMQFRRFSMQKFYHLTFFIINYVLSETMHHVSNPLVPNKIIIQDLFLPTSCVDSYNTRSLIDVHNFPIHKSNLEIQKYTFSRIGAKLWNEMPTNIRNLPKDKFKKRIQALLFEILEPDD